MLQAGNPSSAVRPSDSTARFVNTLDSPLPLCWSCSAILGRTYSTWTAGVGLSFSSGSGPGIPFSLSLLLSSSSGGVGYSICPNHEFTLVQDVLGVT